MNISGNHQTEIQGQLSQMQNLDGKIVVEVHGILCGGGRVSNQIWSRRGLQNDVMVATQ